MNDLRAFPHIVYEQLQLQQSTQLLLWYNLDQLQAFAQWQAMTVYMQYHHSAMQESAYLVKLQVFLKQSFDNAACYSLDHVAAS